MSVRVDAAKAEAMDELARRHVRVAPYIVGIIVEAAWRVWSPERRGTCPAVDADSWELRTESDSGHAP